MNWYLSFFVVPDKYGRGIPVAASLCSSKEAPAVEQMFTALKRAAQEVFPEWQPSCFFTDNDAAQIKGFR